MPKIRTRVYSKGTRTAPGGTYGPLNLDLARCTVERVGDEIWLEFNGQERMYPRVHTRWPVELAQRLAKIILSEADGLWNSWSTDFPE